MNVVHAYLGNLGQLSVKACLSLLDDDERQRAANLANQHARHEFIRTRALLRVLLSRHTGLSTRDVRFDIGTCGKPVLRNGRGTHFNVSHSGGMALIAIAPSEVGVDIERIDRKVDCAGVAESVFSSDEIEQLRSCASEGQREAFFTTWTRKEAYLKATGQGFSSNLPAISTCSLQGQIEDRACEKQDDWHAFDLPMPPAFKAALVVASRRCTIETGDIAGPAQLLLFPDLADAA